MSSNTIRRVGLGAVAVGLAAAGAIAPITSAHAATARNGVCESGEFCFSYNSGFTGSVSDFTASLSNYGSTQPNCYEFRSGTTAQGRGKCIKNQEASVWNRSRYTVRLYTGSLYAGRAIDIKPGVKMTLPTGFKNNIASHRFLPNPALPKPGSMKCMPYVPCAY